MRTTVIAVILGLGLVLAATALLLAGGCERGDQREAAVPQESTSAVRESV